MNNLDEYGFGSDGNDASSRPECLLLSTSSGVTYSYVRRSGGTVQGDQSYEADGLVYRTNTSLDLVDWTTVATQTTNPLGLSLPATNYEWVTYELPIGGKGFLRVELEDCR